MSTKFVYKNRFTLVRVIDNFCIFFVEDFQFFSFSFNFFCFLFTPSQNFHSITEKRLLFVSMNFVNYIRVQWSDGRYFDWNCSLGFKYTKRGERICGTNIKSVHFLLWIKVKKAEETRQRAEASKYINSKNWPILVLIFEDGNVRD